MIRQIIIFQIILTASSITQDILETQDIQIRKEGIYSFVITQEILENFSSYQKNNTNYLIIQFTWESKSNLVQPLLIAGEHDTVTFKSRSFQNRQQFTNTALSYKGIQMDLQNWAAKNKEYLVILTPKIEEYKILIYDTQYTNEFFNGTLRTYISDQNICQKNCSQNGICFKGQCICFSKFYGYDCSLNINNRFLSPSDWAVQKIKITQNDLDSKNDILARVYSNETIYVMLLYKGDNDMTIPYPSYDPFAVVIAGQSQEYNISYQIIRDYIDRIQRKSLVISPILQFCFYSKEQKPVDFKFKVERYPHNGQSEGTDSEIYQYVLIGVGVTFFFICLVIIYQFVKSAEQEAEARQTLANQIRQININNNNQHQNHRQQEQRRAVAMQKGEHTLSYRIVDQYMPVQQFTDVKEQYPNILQTNSECIICLDEFSPDIDCRMTICLHLFHAQCLIDWLKRHENCPFCRENLNRKALTEEKKQNQFLQSQFAHDLQEHHHHKKIDDENSVFMFQEEHDQQEQKQKGSGNFNNYPMMVESERRGLNDINNLFSETDHKDDGDYRSNNLNRDDMTNEIHIRSSIGQKKSSGIQILNMDEIDQIKENQMKELEDKLENINIDMAESVQMRDLQEHQSNDDSPKSHYQFQNINVESPHTLSSLERGSNMIGSSDSLDKGSNIFSVHNMDNNSQLLLNDSFNKPGTPSNKNRKNQNPFVSLSLNNNNNIPIQKSYFAPSPDIQIISMDIENDQIGKEPESKSNDEDGKPHS